MVVPLSVDCTTIGSEREPVQHKMHSGSTIRGDGLISFTVAGAQKKVGVVGKLPLIVG